MASSRGIGGLQLNLEAKVRRGGDLRAQAAELSNRKLVFSLTTSVGTLATDQTTAHALRVYATEKQLRLINAPTP